MHRIGRRRNEIEFLIEVPRLLIFRMHRKCPDTGNVGGLKRALQGVPQKRLSDSLAVPPAINSQPSKQHNRHRMARKPLAYAFRRFRASDLAYCERVVTDNNIAGQANIGFGCAPAAVESFHLVIGPQLFSTALCCH